MSGYTGERALLAVALSDFEDGRWMPPLGDAPSVNFEFLTSEPSLRRVCRLAEASFASDPNTTLMKMRQFAEILTQEVAPVFGVGPYPGESQFDLLKRLERSHSGPERRVLDDLHAMRVLGNKASHDLEGSHSEAKDALRRGQRVAYWYERTIHSHSVPVALFTEPPDPRKVWAEKMTAMLQEKDDALKQARAAQEKALEETERARAETEKVREEIEIVSGVAEEAGESAAELRQQLHLARKLASISESLTKLGLDEPNKPGLPDWTAAVAGGEDPPEELSALPEETIEDLRQLGKDVELPPTQTPQVVLKSTGNLTATGSDRFKITVALHGPDSAHDIQREIGSGIWRDAEGRPFVLPGELRAALDTLAQGPPAQEEGQAAAQLTQERQLWWGRLRRRLEPFGVELDRYLNGSDAIVVEKLTAHLRERPDGSIELLVGAGDVSPEELTPVVDQMRDPRRSPTIRRRRADGSLNNQRLVFSPSARKAIIRTKQVRAAGRGASAQLIDAPHSILDPEFFDLSEYSDRVVAFGTPVYRVSRSMVEDNPSGTKRFRLQQVSGAGVDSDETGPLPMTPEEEEELITQLRAASVQGLPYVRFKNGWVRVPPAPTVEELEESTTSSGRRGSLVVAENLDEEQFAPGDSGQGHLADVPERPPGLSPDFDLLEHQKLGFSWLAGHAKVGTAASDHGMLADDMGLGKTLQVLSLLSFLKEEERLSPTLIVAPLSLIPNWAAEADRFFPGRFSKRIQLGAGVRMKAEALKSYDLVLASYETVRSQQLQLGRVRWKTMVCDESHRFRNPTAQTTHAIYAMEADCRLALTGTPIQNSLRDLWAQFDWLAPSFLGDLRTFTSNYQGAAIRRNPEERARRLGTLKQQLQARVLRRLKEQEIADDLPAKQEVTVQLPLEPSQVRLYNHVVEDFRSGEIASMAAMTRLFLVCAAPSVFSLGHGGEDGFVGPKLRWLCRKIQEIRSRGERAVIFAEWYKVQDLVASTLSALLGEPVDRINGTVETGLRLAKIDAFNRGENGTVLVLGPKAAGVGLNITGANHVIHFTRHWNPALESQATDRVYRIGQNKPVTVYRPVMTHPDVESIEQHLDGLLQVKEKLAKDILVGIEELSVKAELQNFMSSRLTSQETPLTESSEGKD